MKRKIKLVFTVVVTMCIVSTVIAGEEKTKDMKVECGDIIKSEFTKSMAAHEYQLNMKPEDAFKIQIAAIGDHFYPRVDVYEPGKNAILSSNRFGHHRKAQTEYESGVLSGRGDYTIKVYGKMVISGQSAINCMIVEQLDVFPSKDTVIFLSSIKKK